MAKKLDSYVFTRGSKFKYRWDQWFDGNPWRLTKGVDFHNDAGRL